MRLLKKIFYLPCMSLKKKNESVYYIFIFIRFLYDFFFITSMMFCFMKNGLLLHCIKRIINQKKEPDFFSRKCYICFFLQNKTTYISLNKKKDIKYD